MASRSKSFKVRSGGGGARCCALILSALLVGCSGQSSAETDSFQPITRKHPQTLLIPSSEIIDLGVVPQGGKKEATFWLTNPRTDPVEIVGIETSCACLVVDLAKKSISPGEKMPAVTKLQLEPDFVGRLFMEVTAFSKHFPEPAFQLNVEVIVQSSN